MAHRFQARVHHLAEVERSRSVVGIAVDLGFGGRLGIATPRLAPIRAEVRATARPLPALRRPRDRTAIRPRGSRIRSRRRRTRCDAGPESRQLLLGGKGSGVILRMIAHIFAERQRRIGFERRVEADEQRLALVDALKPVHPVGHRDVVFGRALALPAQEIPRRPGPPAFRHQSDVTMQIDCIWRVADGAENGPFVMRRRPTASPAPGRCAMRPRHGRKVRFCHDCR